MKRLVSIAIVFVLSLAISTPISASAQDERPPLPIGLGTITLSGKQEGEFKSQCNVNNGISQVWIYPITHCTDYAIKVIDIDGKIIGYIERNATSVANTIKLSLKYGAFIVKVFNNEPASSSPQIFEGVVLPPNIDSAKNIKCSPDTEVGKEKLASINATSIASRQEVTFWGPCNVNNLVSSFHVDLTTNCNNYSVKLIDFHGKVINELDFVQDAYMGNNNRAFDVSVPFGTFVLKIANNQLGTRDFKANISSVEGYPVSIACSPSSDAESLAPSFLAAGVAFATWLANCVHG